MKLSEFSLKELVELIKGDDTPTVKRSGPELVKLFNANGTRDIYDFDNGGLPKLNGRTMNTSRKDYVFDRLKKINNSNNLANLLTTVINVSDETDRDTINGMNATLSWVLKNAMENNNGTPMLIPEKIYLHRGYLIHLDNVMVERLEEKTIRITWSVNSSTDFWREHEKFQVIAYVPDRKLVFWQQEGNYRKSGLQIIQLPWSQANEDQVLLFGGFFSLERNKGEYSDIIYLGRV